MFALAGAHVFALGRDVPKTQAVADAINLEAGDPSRVDVVECDLSSLASVRAAAACIIATGVPLSVLLNNAGVCFPNLSILPSRKFTWRPPSVSGDGYSRAPCDEREC